MRLTEYPAQIICRFPPGQQEGGPLTIHDLRYTSQLWEDLRQLFSYADRLTLGRMRGRSMPFFGRTYSQKCGDCLIERSEKSGFDKTTLTVTLSVSDALGSLAAKSALASAGELLLYSSGVYGLYDEPQRIARARDVLWVGLQNAKL